ncbi:MarR family EPS-associated transcriptional regulator [Marivivens sp. JLT3646]|uniref:MarR family EPS-associated transcriptional regulator n=1 Tax=Marivivens sp. JLT3646 TaxID=1920883 RepID=UPI00093857EE|nr:MarR family EPS-associated transcriptional regulator [Marivivens sp. JLT3646]APO88540.1 MarR family EPS-associated transcriptional regulator [Marivivens sp. JLT3646]
MASLREARREEAQFQVMRLVAQNPELTTREIAKEVGISTGAAYYCVTALVEKGFVKLENFKNNPRKGQYAYVLTPRGIREKAVLTLRFLERKAAEYEALRLEIAALEREAGLDGARSSLPVDR